MSGQDCILMFKFWISNVLWRFEYFGYCTNERSTLTNNGRIVRLIRSGSKLCIKRFFGMMLCQVYSTIVIGSVVWIFETCIITRSTSYDLVVKVHIIYIWPMMVGVCTLYQKRLQNLMDQISSSITDFFFNREAALPSRIKPYFASVLKHVDCENVLWMARWVCVVLRKRTCLCVGNKEGVWSWVGVLCVLN